MLFSVYQNTAVSIKSPRRRQICLRRGDLKNESKIAPEGGNALHVVGAQEPGYIHALIQAVQQDFGAGAAVAGGVVVVQPDPQQHGQGVKPVVGRVREAGAAHLAGAGVGGPGRPEDAVIPEALGQYGHVEGGVVGHQHPAVKYGPELAPELREVGLARHQLRRDAVELYVEGGEFRLGVHQIVALPGDAPALHHAQADRADPVVAPVRGLGVKDDVTLVHYVPSGGLNASLYRSSIEFPPPSVGRTIPFVAVHIF